MAKNNAPKGGDFVKQLLSNQALYKASIATNKPANGNAPWAVPDRTHDITKPKPKGKK